MNRRRPPRELAGDPEAWPHAQLADPGAAAVQHIARTLAEFLAEHGVSLRRVAVRSGVNRQAVADLINGRSWPDVATVARLGAALAIPLWPQKAAFDGKMSHETSFPARTRANGDRA
ncbi:helix-turn-helix transcriptional regulator [Streptomyces sp. NPDC058766]